MAVANGHSNGQSRQIPVIDISGSLHEDDVAQQLVDAVTTYGFVYIKNEGKDIPVEAIEKQFKLVCALTASFEMNVLNIQTV